MAKPFLDRLKRRYGWTGGSLAELVRSIAVSGASMASEAAGKVQAATLRESARRAGASLSGNLLLPPMEGSSIAFQAVLKKAAQDGDLITDTLREKLQTALRKELAAFYAKPGAKLERGEARGRLDLKAVDEFERAVRRTLEPYCRRLGKPAPSNCRTIAETEVRSAHSQAKHAYAEAVQQANQSRAKIVKRWIWRPELSRVEPRDNHGAINGQVVGIGDRFKVPLLKGGYVMMSHPHDPTAPAGEVINCHCECDYVVKPVPRSEAVQGEPLTRQQREEKADANVYKARKLAGRMEFQGLPISLEHKKGGVREGKDPDGNEWRTKMLFPYGYIRGTRGADGDEVDCFIGDDKDSDKVFIIRTYKPGTLDYDEDKVMLGFSSPVEARRWLEAHYDRYVVQSVEETDVEGLRGLIEVGGKLEVRKSIAVDFDKTLAHDEGGWKGPAHLGEPVKHMLKKVRGWLEDGETVKILTARVSTSLPEAEREAARKAIEEWCVRHLGRKLEVTSDKDPGMDKIYDDKARRVEPNDGHVVKSRVEALKSVEEGLTRLLAVKKAVMSEAQAGAQVELEHHMGPDKAKQIAADHLTEDPDYYKKLQGAGLANELGPQAVIKSVEDFISVWKDTRGMVDVGGRITKPDGSTWERTGPYSYKKVLNPDGSPYQSRSKGTQKVPTAGQAAPVAKPEVKLEAKSEPLKEQGMTHAEADAILKRVGEKGLWNLTKDGLNNWLRKEGEDPSKLTFAEKHAHAKAIMKRNLERDKVEGTVKLKKVMPYTNEDISLPSRAIVEAKFGMDLDTYKKQATPMKGGHWGSARSDNNTAVAVAWSSGSRWRPIDKVKDGKLQSSKQILSAEQTRRGIQLRKYAQDRMKDLDRKIQPNFFRGMTLDQKDWDSIAKGESDTIELTGCTAFSCYEAIADRYSASKWTRSFGADRKAVKIVLERDDDVDESIGMWHPTFSEKNGGGKQPAFELLSGLEAVRVVKVEGGPVEPKAVDEKKRKEIRGKLDAAGSEVMKGIIEYEENKLNDYIERIKRSNNKDYWKGQVADAKKEIETLKRYKAWWDDPDKPEAARKAVEQMFSSKDKADVAYRVIRNVQYSLKNSNQMSPTITLGGALDKSGNYTRQEMIGAGLQDLLDVKVKDLLPSLRILQGRYGMLSPFARRLAGTVGSSKPLVLHCVAGRGKKGVTGGDEESPENVAKSYEGVPGW